MATRFMHYILAWEGVSARNFPDEQRELFLVGSLLPDAVAMRDKKNTHFMDSRLALRSNKAKLRQTLGSCPPALLLGWETHLDLDELWQRTCFRPRLVRAPLLFLRYGIQTGRYYYAEMSSFDVLYRRGLAPEGYKAAKDSVEGLMKYVPPTETGIALPQWELLLAKIKADWEKEDTYTSWEFVGAKTFTRFCSLARQKVVENLLRL